MAVVNTERLGDVTAGFAQMLKKGVDLSINTLAEWCKCRCLCMCPALVQQIFFQIDSKEQLCGNILGNLLQHCKKDSNLFFDSISALSDSIKLLDP